jgi:hypothetical protein
MKSPIALLESLILSFMRLNPGVKGLNRDLVTVKHRLKHEGVGFLTLTLPTLNDALLRGLDEGKFTCPPGFRTIREGAIPVLFQGMLREVFEPSTGQLKDTIEFGVLRDVKTFLTFFKKTQLSPNDEENLHLKAVEEFYRCDETAKTVVIPAKHDRLIDHVGKYILKTLLKKDLEDEYIYRHGPGAVQESYKGNQKWSALYCALRDKSHIPRFFGSTNIRGYSGFNSLQADEIRDPLRPTPISDFSGNWRRTGREGVMGYLPRTLGDPEYEAVLRTLRIPGQGKRRFLSSVALPTYDSFKVSIGGLPNRRGLPRLRGASARLISVLKNSSSRRTITIEPFLRQYLQQGLNTVIRETITECRILRNCLALTDQGKNRVLALEGSFSRNWATIDLKSASDLLSVSLVKSVFRHYPEFFGYMMDSRSPFVHTSGSEPELALGKFAGMGNATTFPVQSIVFAVIGICGVLDNLGISNPSRIQVERASRLVQVYGDDIIVHKDHAHQVVDWLHAVGLKVNVKKSFLKGNFRESCGIEAFRGVDITPLYLRYWPEQIDESPSVCAHLVSLSNQLWLQGLYEVSNTLKDWVEGFLGRALPLVSSQSGSLGWHTRLEAVQPHKWCTRTHQFMTRTFALAPVKFRDRLDGDAALLKCLTTPLLGRDKDHLERTTRRYETRLVRRWVPSYSYDGLNLQV